MNFDFIKPLANTVSEKLPDILIGLGIAGIFGTAIVAVKDTRKHDKNMKKLAEEKEPTKKEKVVQTAKDYIPTMVVGALSATAIVVGTSELHKQIAGITALCALAENSLTDYKKEVKEIIGEEETNKIEDKVELARAKRIEAGGAEQFRPQVIDAYSSVQPFYDLYTGRAFYASESLIQRTINDLNSNMNDGLDICINDYYELVELEPIQNGNDIGWTQEDGLISVRFGAYRGSDGIARTSISFSPKPHVLAGRRW